MDNSEKTQVPESDIYGRLFKLWAMVTKLILDGKRSPHKVADVLQIILEEHMLRFVFYRRAKASRHTSAVVMQYLLKRDGVLHRALSANDDVVKEWLRNPQMYPSDLKSFEWILWKDVQMDPDGVTGVAPAMVWNRDTKSVKIIGYEAMDDFYNPNMAVLLYAK